MFQQAERTDRLKAVIEAIAARQGVDGMTPEALAELAVSAVEKADKAEHDRRLQARLDRQEQMRRDVAEGRAIAT